jgi:hypothetical protein
VGQYDSLGWQRGYPKVQILTVADLLNGAEVKMPPAHTTFKQVQRAENYGGVQRLLDLQDTHAQQQPGCAPGCLFFGKHRCGQGPSVSPWPRCDRSASGQHEQIRPRHSPSRGNWSDH